MNEPVFCEDCDGVQEQTRKEPHYRWLCRSSPRETFNLYTHRGAVTEPFYRCQAINTNGCCELWTPRPKKGSGDAQ